MSFATKRSFAKAIGSCKIVEASSIERSVKNEVNVNGATDPNLRRFSAIGSIDS